MSARTPTRVLSRPFTEEEVALLLDHDEREATGRGQDPREGDEMSGTKETTRRDPDGTKTALARTLLTQAYAASREHSRFAQEMERKHGEGDGRFISGCVRDHFPEEAKERLRDLAYSVSRQIDASLRTWQRAGRTLATWYREKERIKTRDGSGFYG